MSPVKVVGALAVVAGLGVSAFALAVGEPAWLALTTIIVLIGLVFLFQERGFVLTLPGGATLKLEPASKTALPRRTLSIIPEHEDRLWWHMGKIGNEPAMQVVADFHFRNTSKEPVVIPRTFVTFWYFRGGLIPWRARAEGYVFVKHQQSDFHGRCVIPPRARTTGRADWWIRPPVRTASRPFRARACFVDEFGNRHWTNPLTWNYR